MDKKLIFIGNSIVNGDFVDREQCFVSLVADAMGWNVINKGVNGDTTSNLLARFERDVLSLDPDMVFILTGTNDFIYRESSVQNTFKNLKEMANLAENNVHPIRPVFLTPLPSDAEMAAEKWLKGADVDYDQVNVSLEALTGSIKDSGYDYVDLNSKYRSCAKYIDGLHPTAEGHKFIADIIIDYLKRSIKE